MSEWQPIETAPDAETILVYVNDPLGKGVHFGCVYRYPDGTFYPRAQGLHGDWKITHWMPLPEPPQS